MQSNTEATSTLPVCLTITDFRRVYGAGCSKSFVYSEITRGHLRAIKAGRKTLIRRVDADTWLNSRDVREAA